MESLESDVCIRRPLLVEFEQPRRWSGGAGEQIGAWGRISDHRLEQLADRAERKRLLQLRAPRLQQGDLRPLGHDARLAGQLGLADARGTLDQEQGPLSGARAIERLPQRPNLALALKQSSQRTR